MKFIVNVLLLLILTTTFAADFNSEIKEKRQELQDIYKEISKHKTMISDTDRKAKELADEIQSVDSLLVQQNNLLKRIEKQQKVIDKEVDWLEDELGIDKTKFNQILSDLNNKYFYYYKLSNTGFIEQLVEHDSLTDQINMMYMLEALISSDVTFLEDIKKKNTKMKYKGYRLEAQKDILDEKQIAISELRKNIIKNKKKKRYLYKQLLAKKKDYETKASKLLKESKSVEKHLVAMQKKSTNFAAIGDGNFIWPVLGSITSRFGYRIHPILKSRIFHTGLDIGAPMGRPIFASDAGVVLFSGKWGNYGNIVIIDHGSKTTTLYAHMSKYLVKKKVKVAKGQVIGLVGQTGLATGPHLHFEIRKNGKVEDPLKYLPKR